MKTGMIITGLACLLTLSACNEAASEAKPEMHDLVTVTCYFGGEKIIHRGTTSHAQWFARITRHGTLIMTGEPNGSVVAQYSSGVPCRKVVEEVPVGSQK